MNPFTLAPSLIFTILADAMIDADCFSRICQEHEKAKLELEALRGSISSS